MHTYKVNTGLESRLEYAVNDLKLKNDELNIQLVEERDRSMGYTKEIEELKSEIDELEHAYNNMKQYADKLLDENVEVGERNEELKTNMALMTDEIAELEKAYKNECHETGVYKKAWREQREIVALRDDQIAMLERRLAKRASEND
jgi:chromosome segregation ATPase